MALVGLKILGMLSPKNFQAAYINIIGRALQLALMHWF